MGDSFFSQAGIGGVCGFCSVLNALHINGTKNFGQPSKAVTIKCIIEYTKALPGSTEGKGILDRAVVATQNYPGGNFKDFDIKNFRSGLQQNGKGSMAMTGESVIDFYNFMSGNISPIMYRKVQKNLSNDELKKLDNSIVALGSKEDDCPRHWIFIKDGLAYNSDASKSADLNSENRYKHFDYQIILGWVELPRVPQRKMKRCSIQ